MTTDDPFFGDQDSDRTVLKPTPGGRRGAAPANPTPPPAPPPRPAAPPPPSGGAPGRRVANVITPGQSALVDSAGPLLALATQLRFSTSHADPNGLNQHIAAEIQAFENAARGRGCKPEHVLAARYALCTFLDEIVLSTPWGANSGWSESTLLSRFHREGYGGEKFFAILDRVAQDPGANIDIIELLNAILLLGFEGKYRIDERGRQELRTITDGLALTIRAHRGEAHQELSPRWRGVKDLRSPLQRYVPLWAVAAVSAAVLAGVYMLFSLKLGSESAPVVNALTAIGRERAVLSNRTVSKARRLDIAGFLAPEVAAGLVAVEDRPGRSIITLRGTGLFAPGSARLTADRAALVARVAEALNTENGKVHAVGHTDNIPISGSLRLRFPTNVDLSQARADEIVQKLALNGVIASRLSAEGRGAVEPLVENDTRENRALNRRVELTLSARGR
ncbi:MAG: type IVB secretion system protein IcmH/DotU [Gammaproteobacteria bacterium]